MYSSYKEDSFHNAMRPIVRVSHFFGIMPVDVGKSKDVSSIIFRWKSFKTIYSLIFVVLGMCEGFLCLWLVIRNGMTLSYSSALSFYFVSVTGTICLLKLASKWDKLMKFWYEREKVFLEAPYTIQGWTLNRKIRLWGVAFGVLSLSNKLISSTMCMFVDEIPLFPVDHVLFLMNSFSINQNIIDYCKVNESEFFHSYLIAYRYHLTKVIPYHIIQYPIYEWINILMTFSWNFIDLFIILISVALAMRFNQINFRVEKFCCEPSTSENFWNEIRMNYYAMIDLVDRIDHEIAILMLMSTGHNLVSLCVVIFESLTR